MAGVRPSSSLWSLVKTGYAALLSVHFPIRSTGLAIACGGPAMLPTFESKPGDLLLVDRRRLNWFRGDVVLFRRRQDDDFFHRVINRLIGLPGDLVRLRGTRVVREVPEGHCWVEGDNPRESMDSRMYGPVPIDLLEGTVTHIVCPPRRLGAVPGRIPAGSVEEATGLGCLGDSIAPHSKSIGPRFGPRGVPSSVSTARSILDSVGSQQEELGRRECNFVYLR